MDNPPKLKRAVIRFSSELLLQILKAPPGVEFAMPDIDLPVIGIGSVPVDGQDVPMVHVWVTKTGPGPNDYTTEWKAY